MLPRRVLKSTIMWKNLRPISYTNQSTCDLHSHLGARCAACSVGGGSRTKPNQVRGPCHGPNIKFHSAHRMLLFTSTPLPALCVNMLLL